MTEAEVLSVQYRDRCQRCRPRREVVAPQELRRNSENTGVIAIYRCSSGHRWRCAWGWWDGHPHDLPGEATAEPSPTPETGDLTP